MQDITVRTQSEEETALFAKGFARNMSVGDIVLLYGDLGMGKSVFSRSVIRSLCDDENLEVPSPTFTLVQLYDCNIGTLWHFDLYRLGDMSEIYELGWDDALDGGIVLVEWPERLGENLPKGAYKVEISAHQENPQHRTISVKHI